MPKLSGADIRKLAVSLVKERPGGIRYSVLVNEIAARSPETPVNTIHGSVWNLASNFPEAVTKPSRGLYKPAGADGDDAELPMTLPQASPPASRRVTSTTRSHSGSRTTLMRRQP
jgi:hypothetical protein